MKIKYAAYLMVLVLAGAFLKGCNSGGGTGSFGSEHWTGNLSSTDLSLDGGTGILYGNIIDQLGKPVGAAVVKVSKSGVTTTSFFSGSDGSFKVSIASGVFDIAVSKSGYADFSTKTTVKAGEKTYLNVEMSSKFTFSGIVKLNTTGEGLANIPVEIRKDSVSQGTTVTTNDGKFTFQDLSVGGYELSLASGSQIYNPASYAIQILKDGSVYPTGKDFALSVNLGSSRPKYTVSGNIYDAFSKAPLEYVDCSIKGFGTVISDNQGIFTFANIPEGQQELSFSKAGFNAMTVNFSLTTGVTTPASLSYGLVYSEEKNMGSIVGRYINETTRDGVPGLIVRLYEWQKTTKKVSRLTTTGGQNATPTYTVGDESYWEFISSSPQPVKSTHTGTDSPGVDNSSGTFKITYLKPTTDSLKYFIFIGTNDASVKTAAYAVGTPTQTIWYQEDATNPNKVHSWQEVEVKPNTTTFLTNYDREYK